MIIKAAEKRELERLISKLNAEKRELEEEFIRLESELNSLTASKSWKLTKPIRQASRVARKLRRK